jgi:hypothetical protein
LFSRPALSKNRVLLRGFIRSVTRFGGLVSKLEFLSKVGFGSNVQGLMNFEHAPSSFIPPAYTLMDFLCSVVAGAIRFAHLEWGDE